MSEEPKDIRELLNKKDYSKSMDLRGNPIGDICVCGSELFLALIYFEQ